MSRQPPPEESRSEGERDILQVDWPSGEFDVRSTTLFGLFVLAVFNTLYVARAIFLPLTLAVLLSFLLAPVVRVLRWVGIPESVGAGAALLVLGAGFVAGGYYLAPAAGDWIDSAPTRLRRFQLQTRELKEPLERVQKAQEAVEKIAEVEDQPEETAQVQIEEGPSMIAVTVGFLGQATFVVIIAYLLLASRNLFLRKTVRLLPSLDDKKRAVELARETEEQISAFLFSRTLINVALGAATSLAMWALGLPNPVLWGVLAGLFNYVPYLGSGAMIVVLGLAAAMTWDDLLSIGLPPLAFLVLTSLEAYVVTPLVMSRQFAMNLVAVFAGLFFWAWLWGPAGALIAVPLMATLKIVGDKYERLRPLGEFLGR